MVIGYIRPNHEDRNGQIQRKRLQAFPCDLILAEKHDSSKHRIQLQQLLERLTPGDIVVVTKLFVLADSTRHLVELLEHMTKVGAFFLSLEENIDTRFQTKKSFLEMVKHLAQFQSDVMSERTKDGLDKAKQQGVSSGRPKKPDENVKRAIGMYESKRYSLEEIRNETGISKSTLYRYLER